MSDMLDYQIVDSDGKKILKNLEINNSTAVIPDGINVIDEESFSADCKEKITQIELPSSVTQISKKSFYGMKALSQVYLSSNIEIIEEEAFAECCSIEKLRFPASLKKVESKAFYNTGIKSCVLNDKVEVTEDAFPENCVIHRIDEFGSEWF